MEDFRKLEQRELSRYGHMIPKWLLRDSLEDDTLEIWGMEDWEEACGAAVISRKPDVVELLHIYIAEEYRGNGRGSRFLTELIYYAYKLGASRFQVKFIAEQFPKLEKLLKGYPMQQAETEMVGNVESTLEELAQLPYLKGSYGNIRALSECTTEGLSSLYTEISSRGLDWVEFPLKKEDYMTDYSAVVMEGGKPAGLLLVKKTEGGVMIPYMVNLSRNVAAPVEMIRFAVQKGIKKLPLDTKCQFAIINGILLTLLEKMGMKVRKRQCAELDLSYLEESEQSVAIQMEFMQETASLRRE